MPTHSKLISAVLFLLVSAMPAQEISEKLLRQHVNYLASSKLKGRGTSTEGEKLAAAYIAGQFSKIGLKQLRGSYLRPFTFRKSSNPHDTVVANLPERSSNNVVGFLDNKQPNTIVIGAHYDHLGLGQDHNSLDANPEGKIHYGADDNASGTAGVLELARYFASNGKAEPFNFLFICFSGEELGLLGSKKWCEDPDLPLVSFHCMINLDMVGRLNDSTHKLVVYGVGTSPSFVPMIDSLKTSLSVKKDSSGIGPSDQTSFYLKDVPVLHFFTGQHADYHKPTDTPDKLNYRGEAEVLRYIIKLTEMTMHYPKLTFSKTRTPDTGKVSFKVTMGVMPDYTFEGEGMRIDGVTDNKPAARAGIVKGDVVTRVGDVKVKDVQTYMKALSAYKKGDTVEVEVMRNGKPQTMKVTF